MAGEDTHFTVSNPHWMSKFRLTGEQPARTRPHHAEHCKVLTSISKVLKSLGSARCLFIKAYGFEVEARVNNMLYPNRC